MNVMDRIAELPAWFKGTAVGAAIVREQLERAHAKRQSLVEELAQRRFDLTAAETARVAADAPLRKAAALARDKAAAADRRLLDCFHEHAEIVGGIRTDIDRLERLLRASADEAIDQALGEMFARFDRARGTLIREVDTPTGELNEQLKPVMRRTTNEPAIVALRAAMRAARDAFDRLRLENPSDLDGAIAAILRPVDEAWTAVHEIDDDGPAAA